MDFDRNLRCDPPAVDAAAMAAVLAAMPRLRVAHTPTAFERLNRLSAHLGGPRLWIKRDDCTGLAGGGNKARKLDFLIAAALAAGADTLVTAGAIQSNHARQVAAAAARFDLRCILVLTDTVAGRDPLYRRSGNIAIDRLLGADVHLVSGHTESAPAMEAIAENLRLQGKAPFIIPLGGSNAVGSLGYVDGFAELLSQFAHTGERFAILALATGSGGTQAGLLLGAYLTRWSGTILGISVGATAERQREKVHHIVRAAAAILKIEGHLPDPSEIVVDDRFVGPGYGHPDAATIEAIRKMAEHEGILLDPVYSGKAMAGLIAHIRAGKFKPQDNVVFLHTGGSQVLSAYPEHF